MPWRRLLKSFARKLSRKFRYGSSSSYRLLGEIDLLSDQQFGPETQTVMEGAAVVAVGKVSWFGSDRPITPISEVIKLAV